MEHLTPQQIEGYRKGTLAAVEDYILFDQHLADCDACKGHLRSAAGKIPPALLNDLVVHPEDEQILLYTQERESVPVDVARHIQVCPQCQSDTAALRRFRARLNETAAETAPARPSSVRHSWGIRSAGSLALGAGVAALLVFTLGVVPQRRQHDRVLAQLSEAQRARDRLARDTEAALNRSQREIAAARRESARTLARKDVQILELSKRLKAVQKETPPSQSRPPRPTPVPPPAPETPLAARNDLDWDQFSRQIRPGQPTFHPPEKGPSNYMSGPPDKGDTSVKPVPLVHPVSTYVYGTRPELVWKSVDGATGYSVVVTDAKYKPVDETKTPVRATSFTLTQSLQPGQLYNWEVTALQEGMTIARSEARFRMMESGKAKALAPIKMKLGELYFQAALYEDAEREFRDIPPSDPGYPLAQKRLQEISKRKK